MPTIRARFAAVVPIGLALAATLAASACSGGGPKGSLPVGSDLLKQSSTAMAAVTSVSFQVTTDGQPNIPIKSADGKLLKSGDAQGTVQLKQLGQNVELNFTLAGDSVYIKGATGGYKKLPRALVTSIYDPSAILDPQRGVSMLLTKAADPKVEAKEKVGGEDAYRVRATLSKDAASALIPGLSKDVSGQVWIGASDHRVLKVKADVPAASGGGSGSVTVTFTDFNGNFTIKAPA